MSKRDQSKKPPSDQKPAQPGDPLADLAAAEELQNEDLSRLQAELAEVQDRALRNRAELENYRKRAAREMQDVQRYASLPLMRDLLPVLDNLQRGIEAAEQNHDVSSLLEGVKLVAGQFADALAQHGCTEIKALGEPFDPNLHEAILQQPSEEHPPGTVTMVTQQGFQLNERVVRPSKVIVSSGSDTEGPKAESNDIQQK